MSAGEGRGGGGREGGILAAPPSPRQGGQVSAEQVWERGAAPSEAYTLRPQVKLSEGFGAFFPTQVRLQPHVN